MLQDDVITSIPPPSYSQSDTTILEETTGKILNCYAIVEYWCVECSLMLNIQISRLATYI